MIGIDKPDLVVLSHLGSLSSFVLFVYKLGYLLTDVSTELSFKPRTPLLRAATTPCRGLIVHFLIVHSLFSCYIYNMAGNNQARVFLKKAIKHVT